MRKSLIAFNARRILMRVAGMTLTIVLLFLGCELLICTTTAMAEDTPSQNDADLAQDLTNPLADLMTIPVQMTYDYDIGLLDEGIKVQTNIQPVYPIHLNSQWNLITRTILPVIYQEDIYPGAGSQFGLGDLTSSFYISPLDASEGLIWGLGGVVYVPSGTDDLLGADKWGAGPTGIALKMSGPWTVGGLFNHIWSFAGDSDRQDINSTFMQPFVAYTWSNAWSFSLQSETTYNWQSEEWAVPVNAAFSKLVFLGKLPVSLQAGVGYWLESTDTGAEGWRFRLQANFVLPTL